MDDQGGPRAFDHPNSYHQRHHNYREYPAQQGSSYATHPGHSSYPPLPPGPPPTTHQNQMYRFGQQYTNGHVDQHAQQFNLNSNSHLPSYPDQAPRANRYRDRRDYNRYDRDRDRQPYQKRVRIAADRPLLHTRRDSTPDQFDGMQDSNEDIPKFRNIDTMSDSESEVMEESDSENENSTKKTEIVVEGPVAPKWSNPEPYTSLPPPEASKKRRDVVKLIRKARIAAMKENEGMKQLAQNDDFISFGFEDENPEAPANAHVGARDGSHVNLNGGYVVQADSKNGARSGGGLNSTNGTTGVHQRVVNNIAGRLANHKRKRSAEDVGDQDDSSGVQKRLKTVRASQPTGEVLLEWVTPATADSSTPWAEQHQWTENSGFRLHKEICDFYEFVKPCDFEETMRLDLLNRIRKSVKKLHSNCEVHAFGSFAVGLYLPDADLDIVVVSQDFASRGVPFITSNNALYRLSDYLIREDIASPSSVEVITKAKVPLIKFKDNLTGIRVDVSFENLTGPRANLTFREWKTAYPAMPILVTVIKQFLMMRGLNEVVNGGIGGFSVTCLVTALLQNMPRVQTGEIIPEQHLGEMLLEFLDLYGNEFDLYGTAIDLNPPRFVDKARVTTKKIEARENRLHIIDPNDRTNDISGGSRNVAFIFKLFSYARIETLRAMRNNDPTSVLQWMLGGNYNLYTDQRRHLRQLYKAGKWLSNDMNNEEQLLNDLIAQQTRNMRQLAILEATRTATQTATGTKTQKTSSFNARKMVSKITLVEALQSISEGPTTTMTSLRQQNNEMHQLVLPINVMDSTSGKARSIHRSRSKKSSFQANADAGHRSMAPATSQHNMTLRKRKADVMTEYDLNELPKRQRIRNAPSPSSRTRSASSSGSSEYLPPPNEQRILDAKREARMIRKTAKADRLRAEFPQYSNYIPTWISSARARSIRRVIRILLDHPELLPPQSFDAGAEKQLQEILLHNDYAGRRSFLESLDRSLQTDGIKQEDSANMGLSHGVADVVSSSVATRSETTLQNLGRRSAKPSVQLKPWPLACSGTKGSAKDPIHLD